MQSHTDRVQGQGDIALAFPVQEMACDLLTPRGDPRRWYAVSWRADEEDFCLIGSWSFVCDLGNALDQSRDRLCMDDPPAIHRARGREIWSLYRDTLRRFRLRDRSGATGWDTLAHAVVMAGYDLPAMYELEARETL